MRSLFTRMGYKRKRRKKKLWSIKSEYTHSDGTVVSMDSTWEVACARKLDELGVSWQRDPSIKIKYQTKRKRVKHYIPDFYLPDYDLYIEVKGYWTDRAKHKMKDVLSRHPGRICMLESLADIAALTLPILPCTGSIS